MTLHTPGKDKAEIAKLKQDIKEYKELDVLTGNELTDELRKNDDLQASLKVAQEELENTKEELDILRAQKDYFLDIERHAKRLRTLHDKIEELEDALVTADSERGGLISKVNELNKECAAFQTQAGARKKECFILKNQLEALRAEIECWETDPELTASLRKDEYTKIIKVLESRLQEIKERASVEKILHMLGGFVGHTVYDANIAKAISNSILGEGEK